MRLWQKIFLSSFMSSVVLFCFCGFSSVVTGLHFSLERETSRTQYNCERVVVKTREALEEQAHNTSVTTIEQAISYLKSLQKDFILEDKYLRLYVDGKLAYDAFGKSPAVLRYRFDASETDEQVKDSVYMKDIDDTRYLFVEEQMHYDEYDFTVAIVNDLSPIYASCNTQLLILTLLCVVQALLAAIIMLLISRTITKPIEVLSDATKIFTGESYAVPVPITGEDEIGELCQNFNLMAQTIEDNVHNYKKMVGNMIHELKTPLTSIIGYAQILQNEKCDDSMREMSVNYILSESTRLNSLIKKMVNLYKLQPSSLTITEEDAIELIKSAVAIVNLRAIEKNINIRVYPEAPVICYVDKELIITMFSNLIENAVKASFKNNCIDIHVKNENNALKEVSITDYGIGISKEEVSKIEKPFYKAEDTAENYDGFGLGLAICKATINLHEGSMAFSSEI